MSAFDWSDKNSQNKRDFWGTDSSPGPLDHCITVSLYHCAWVCLREGKMSDNNIDDNHQDGGQSDSEQQQQQQQQQQHLPSRLRVLTVYELWWDELDHVLFTNQAEAARCLLHISRILEDCTHLGHERASRLTSEDDEELALLNTRLVRITINDFGNVADSVFRHMSDTSDVNFLRAAMRFILAYKQACWHRTDDFYIIFSADALQFFIHEHVNTTDVLLGARLAFLGGDLIEETDVQSPFTSAHIGDVILSRFKDGLSALRHRKEDLIAYEKDIARKVKYVEDASIPIPVPGAASSAQSDWDVDPSSVIGSVDHELTLLVGNLQLLNAVASFTEFLPSIIEANVVQDCLDILQLPLMSLCLFALGFFNAVLVHKKISLDFIAAHGLMTVGVFAETAMMNESYVHDLAPYISNILVALCKHSQVLEEIVKSEEAARTFLAFGLSLCRANSIETHLNVVEWIGDCFTHPLLLNVLLDSDILLLMQNEFLRVARPTEHSLDTDSDSQRQRLRTQITRTLLKLTSTVLYWQICYSPSQSVSIDNFTLSSSFAHVETVSHGPLLTRIVNDSSVGLKKIDDDILLDLEARVIRTLMETGTLPVNMTVDLISRSNDDHSAMASKAPTSKQHVSAIEPRWSLAKLFIDSGTLELLLQISVQEVSSLADDQSLLDLFALLCLDPGVIYFLLHHDAIAPLQENLKNKMYRKVTPLELLLSVVEPDNHREAPIVRSALQCLSALCTPPQFRCNSNDLGQATALLEDFARLHSIAVPSLAAAKVTTTPEMIVKKQIEFTGQKLRDFKPEQVSELERVQQMARKAVRSCSGINSVVQLLNVDESDFQQAQMLLEIIKVLLGLVQDADIRAILSKMNIPYTLMVLMRSRLFPEYSHFLERLSVKEKKILELYCGIFSSFLSSHPALRESAEEIKTSLVEQSRLDFCEDELLQLVKEHLLSKGLSMTAAMLEREMNGKADDDGLVPSAKKRSRSAEGDALAVSHSAANLCCMTHTSSHDHDSLLVSHKKSRGIAETESAAQIPRSMSFHQDGSIAGGSKSLSQSLPKSQPNERAKFTAVIHRSQSVPVSKAQVRRNMLRAIQEPSLTDDLCAKSETKTLVSSGGSSSSTHMTTPVKRPAQEVTTIAPKPRSKLANIMKHYLKLQHSQCKHPITTLPLQSLQKPHQCAAPVLPSHRNIVNLLNKQMSLEQSWHFNHQYADVYSQRLQYIYSAYRPVRTIHHVEQDMMITAVAFAPGSTKLWAAYHDLGDWIVNSGGVGLIDPFCGTQLSLSGIDVAGVITDFQFTPLQATAPLILTSVSNDPYHFQGRRRSHKLLLWKNTDDVDVFNQPVLRNIEFRDDGASDVNTATPEDDFSTECFHPSGRSIIAMLSDDYRQSKKHLAVVIDVETGTVMQKLRNDSNWSYRHPNIQCVHSNENQVVMDGKLWDLRTSQCTHRFDKLSNYGLASVHPFRSEVIIDGAAWDLRMPSVLRQTIPRLDGCKVTFDPNFGVIFGHRPNEYAGQDKSNPKNSEYFFHVLDPNDYSVIHSEANDKQESMIVMGLDIDSSSSSLLSTFLFCPMTEETRCRIYDIGKRKTYFGDEDDEEDEEVDDYDEFDEDYESGDGDEDEEDDDEDEGDDMDDDEDSFVDDDDADDDIDDDTYEDDDEDDDDDDDDDFDIEEDEESYGSGSGPDLGNEDDDDDEEEWVDISDDEEANMSETKSEDDVMQSDNVNPSMDNVEDEDVGDVDLNAAIEMAGSSARPRRSPLRSNSSRQRSARRRPLRQNRRHS